MRELICKYTSVPDVLFLFPFVMKENQALGKSFILNKLDPFSSHINMQFPLLDLHQVNSLASLLTNHYSGIWITLRVFNLIFLPFHWRCLGIQDIFESKLCLYMELNGENNLSVWKGHLFERNLPVSLLYFCYQKLIGTNSPVSHEIQISACSWVSQTIVSGILFWVVPQ